MLYKANAIIGIPVIVHSTGRKTAHIEDVIVDQHANRIAGLIVDRGGWRGAARVIPWSKLIALQAGSVRIASFDAIVEAERIPPIKQLLENPLCFTGMRVWAADGRPGTVTDIFFDGETGKIEGYEVMMGWMLAGRIRTRLFVPAVDAVVFDEPHLSVGLIRLGEPDSRNSVIWQNGYFSENQPTLGE